MVIVPVVCEYGYLPSEWWYKRAVGWTRKFQIKEEYAECEEFVFIWKHSVAGCEIKFEDNINENHLIELLGKLLTSYSKAIIKTISNQIFSLK